MLGFGDGGRVAGAGEIGWAVLTMPKKASSTNELGEVLEVRLGGGAAPSPPRRSAESAGWGTGGAGARGEPSRSTSAAGGGVFSLARGGGADLAVIDGGDGGSTRAEMTEGDGARLSEPMEVAMASS